ncbi:MAG TPA: thioredoxin domain-containing protein [Polyangiaceae bacterium]|jgi:protein-disulfide isomerase|nr:thioredoxin domain-containing protein [Polyangiaceae bacterium]
MLRPGSQFGARFRVVQNFADAASTIALAEELNGARRVWLALLPLSASAVEVAVTLEQQSRFALGVPGLARPIASGIDGGIIYVAFVAPAAGSIAQASDTPWSPPRVAALLARIAGALAPLHDQGIAHGAIRPEFVAEGEGDVLFGFGLAALATRFGAPGEASQQLAPHFRAPELRAALVAPTPASDVFALGVLLQELLAGAGAAEKNWEISELGLAPPLAELLARACATEPHARPHDLRAFATEFAGRAALEPLPATEPAPEVEDPRVEASAETSLPSPQRPPPPPPFTPERMPPPKPSNRGAWVALVAVLAGFALMFGGAIVGTFYAVRHGHRALTKSHASPHYAAPSPPRVTVPGPSDDPAPSPSTSASPAKKAPKAAIAHAPLVPPGLGPSAFPEDARALVPVLGSEPIWGTRGGPLTWVLFGDLECPHTRRAWRALEVAKTTFGDDLRIVFRHRPLSEHPYALEAARVLAGLEKERGARAFFNVLHRIAQDDTGLSDERLLGIISGEGYAGLQVDDLERAGESVVAADLELAGQFAVRSTPLSFVNGLRVEGERTPDELERLLLDERRSVTWVLASGAPARDLYATRTSGNLIGVGEQEATRVCVPLGNSPVRGPADALVTLVEFSDFECPYCKQVEPTLKALLARYPKTLRLVWKDYPLPQHKSARLLANFAAEASAHGSSAAFWTVHDGLFARADEIDDSVLGELAGKAGLDGAPLLIAARMGAHDAAIRADIALGERVGVNGTPTFFVNGRRVPGLLALEQFDALIRSEIAGAERIVAHGVPRNKLYKLVCDE